MVRETLFYVLLTGVLCRAELWIEPEQSEIVLAAGDTLRLDCIHEYNPPEISKGMFKKDGTTIPVTNSDGYNISLQKKVLSSGMRSTITLSQSHVTVSDTGTYSCDNNGVVKTVSVIVVKVHSEDHEIGEDPVDSIELVCSIVDPPSYKLNNVSWTWVHGNTILQPNGKYELFNTKYDGVLRINKPDRNDIGKYECLLGKTYEIATRKSTYTHLKAKAHIDVPRKHAIDHGIEFTCRASGYPRPVIVWTKNSAVLNSSLIIDESDISTTSLLKIQNINPADDGTYACTAYSDLDSENTTVEFNIDPQVRAQISGAGSINDILRCHYSTIFKFMPLLFVHIVFVYL